EDQAQPGVGVALVPHLQVGKRAQRVDPGEVPELDEHRAPADQLVHPEEGDVQPLEPAGELGGDDVLRCGYAHRRKLAVWAKFPRTRATSAAWGCWESWGRLVLPSPGTRSPGWSNQRSDTQCAKS